MSIQLGWTIIVRRRGAPLTEELANYLVVEHLLMLLVATVAPAGYMAVSIIAIGSLGSNSPYLPQRWHQILAAITTATLILPCIVHDIDAGLMAIGAGLLMVGHVAFNRGGTLILAEEVAASAQFQADHDSLTGLANRRILRAELAKHDAAGTACALLLLDIDNFKEINDTLGHDIGDRVLCEIADRLDGIDDSVVVVRLGGDEFAAIVAGEPDRADAFALRVEHCLAVPIEVGELSLSVRSSIGLAESDGSSATTLLRFADIAMYRAKREGIGPTWYRPEDDPHSERRIVLMQDLPAAIESGEVRPWFQPQVDIATGAVVGGEALARWHHPRYGLIGAYELLGHSDLTGLSRELTLAMLHRSIRAATKWPDGVRLSVNVSLGDVQSASFVDRLTAVLATTGFEPSRLTLEIVEQAAAADAEQVIESIREIRALGVSLSLDDFGQASSSLARLDLFDVDELKIDRHFVSRMIEHERDAAIVHAVVGLADHLGLRLVAEGVEDAEMAAAVAAAGIHVVQGYHYARPAPTMELESFALAERSQPVLNAHR